MYFFIFFPKTQTHDTHMYDLPDLFPPKSGRTLPCWERKKANRHTALVPHTPIQFRRPRPWRAFSTSSPGNPGPIRGAGGCGRCGAGRHGSAFGRNVSFYTKHPQRTTTFCCFVRGFLLYPDTTHGTASADCRSVGPPGTTTPTDRQSGLAVPCVVFGTRCVTIIVSIRNFCLAEQSFFDLTSASFGASLGRHFVKRVVFFVFFSRGPGVFK